MGMILDGIAGAANVGLGILNDRSKTQEAEASQMRLDDRREELAAKRAETVAALKRKTEMEDAEIEQGQYDQIQDVAKQIGSNRDIGSAKSRAPSMDQAALDAVRDNLSPEDQAKFYGIQPQKQSGLINDQMTAARDIGARPGIRKELAGEYKTTLEAEKAQTIAAFREKQSEEKAILERQRFDQTERIAGKRFDVQMAGINARGNGGGGSDKTESQAYKTNTLLFNDVKAELAKLNDKIFELPPGKMGDAKRAELQAKLAKLEVSKEDLIGKLRGESTPTPQSPEKPKAKPVAALPSGSKQIGTKDGKPVYLTPDGRRLIGN